MDSVSILVSGSPQRIQKFCPKKIWKQMTKWPAFLGGQGVCRYVRYFLCMYIYIYTHLKEKTRNCSDSVYYILFWWWCVVLYLCGYYPLKSVCFNRRIRLCMSRNGISGHRRSFFHPTSITLGLSAILTCQQRWMLNRMWSVKPCWFLVEGNILNGNDGFYHQFGWTFL